MLEDEYFRSDYNIRSMLRLLFNSDAFKNARFARIKGPIETVIGTLRLAGDWTTPKPGFEAIFEEMKQMGQEILTSSYKDLLVEISKDPAMVYFLDNCLSHKEAINENYGRELLELFSLGVGMDGKFNYTEDDVKECARAFTGWTISNGIPTQPYGRYTSTFAYNPDDHDEGEKTFLGHTGNFNGEDIIDIICQEPATARFLSRHLYDFFVADEAQVPT